MARSFILAKKKLTYIRYNFDYGSYKTLHNFRQSFVKTTIKPGLPSVGVKL
jgi:hypothetical protein